MPEVFSNWSGSLKFTPGNYIEPEDEDSLLLAVQKFLEKKQKIRIAGAAHSSSPLIHTNENLISLKNFTSIENIDKESSTAWIGTGLTVNDSGFGLLEHGLSFHNTGDVDVQYIAGAISTGTHGTGIKLKNLSSMLIGCRLICADGKIREYSIEKDGEGFFNAMRVSLGTFGIMSKMKLQLLPAFKLERREYCTRTEHCLDHLHDLIHENRNFDFYWYPRSDLVKIRLLNEPGNGTQNLPYAKLVEEKSGWAIEVLPKERDLKFDEMEYALPLENSIACFKEIRDMVKNRFRKTVAWRVLFRTIAADTVYLSPCYGRTTVTISLHQNAGSPFMDYFRAIEPVFLNYGGRPHWGKKHTLQSMMIGKLYPRWNDFLSLRAKMDPEGIFLNEHLSKQLFDLA
jgi:FAD/FMN-containing dehydrogenase